ncbi:hypothetical protein C8J55DRAFT_516622 [Lentinula edodes]|uniref:Uncharacterized protein n=1 Tax=Lentinula lateritia TaxID=40482 RepID=A0A9W9DMM5_9AGAR|nr:hypothetical protein C8J55DRAFT_516622 [Lentinula edodes]
MLSVSLNRVFFCSSMLLTIAGHSCAAAKDDTISQSVISRNFIRSAGFGNWRNDSVLATVNFGFSNFAYTSPHDFVVLDVLPDYDAVFGSQFHRSCRSSECLPFYDSLPNVQSSLEYFLPLPSLPRINRLSPVNVTYASAVNVPDSNGTSDSSGISGSLPSLRSSSSMVQSGITQSIWNN